MFKSKFNKGFSLVELLVSLAIIGVLSGILIPTLSGSFDKSKEKADMSEINNLVSTTQVAVQNNAIYTAADEIANKSYDDKIVMVYYVAGDTLVFDYSYIKTDDDTSVKSNDGSALSADMRKVNDKILTSINGKIEPVQLKSKLYKNKSYEIILTFPDVNFKVDAELVVNNKYKR